MYLLIVSLLIWTGSASLITPRPPHPTPFPEVNQRLEARQTTSAPPICGYHNGNAFDPWAAPTGWFCRQDNTASLWGFCPDSDTQCNLNGYCVDTANCTSGCGFPGQSTIQCTSAAAPRCFLAILSTQQQLNTYFACSDKTSNEFFLATPNTTFVLGAATTSSSSSSSSTGGSGSLTSSTSPTSSSSAIFSSSATNTNTAPSTPSTSSSSSSSSSSNNTGAIVGGVLGGLALIFLIVVGLIFLKRSTRPSNSKTELQPEGVYYDEAPAFVHPVANTGGVHEIYTNKGEVRELDDTSSWGMGNTSMEGGRKTNLNAAELLG